MIPALPRLPTYDWELNRQSPFTWIVRQARVAKRLRADAIDNLRAARRRKELEARAPLIEAEQDEEALKRPYHPRNPTWP
jgi:hypothetical protein